MRWLALTNPIGMKIAFRREDVTKVTEWYSAGYSAPQGATVWIEGHNYNVKESFSYVMEELNRKHS